MAPFSWRAINAITLATTSVNTSIQFYQACTLHLQWYSPSFASLSPSGQKGDSMYVNLFYSDTYAPPAPGIWNGWGRVIFYVDDVNTTYRTVVHNGITPEFAPRDADWGERYFQVLDPMGHEVSFAQPLKRGHARGDGRSRPIVSSVSAAARVLIAYHTVYNHTHALAEAIASGARGAQAEVRVRAIDEVDMEADVLDWADVLLIGSPVHYGNVAAALLAWVEKSWAPYWQDTRFNGMLGGAFATAGGIDQGLESSLLSLQRTLFSFRVQAFAAAPSESDYASYGAIAVTGGAFATNKSGTIAPQFVEAARLFGKSTAVAATEGTRAATRRQRQQRQQWQQQQQRGASD